MKRQPRRMKKRSRTSGKRPRNEEVGRRRTVPCPDQPGWQVLRHSCRPSYREGAKEQEPHPQDGW